MAKRVAEIKVTLRAYAVVEQRITVQLVFDDIKETEADLERRAQYEAVEHNLAGEDWRFLDLDDMQATDAHVEFTRDYK